MLEQNDDVTNLVIEYEKGEIRCLLPVEMRSNLGNKGCIAHAEYGTGIKAFSMQNLSEVVHDCHRATLYNRSALVQG